MYELYEIDKEKFKLYQDVKCNCLVEVSRIVPSVAGIKATLFWNFITLGKCRIYIARQGEELIHTSYVIGKCYKFPFVNGRNRDIEIGPCDTKENFRGRGVYPYVLSTILERELKEGNKAYMIISDANTASKRGVSKVGFSKVAVLRKDRLKRYVIAG